MSALFNYCNLSPWYIASKEFNENPQEIELMGVRRENTSFFKQLDETDDKARRGEIFNEYMSVKFHLHQWEDHESTARSSLRNSYIRFLRGWGLDSNSIEGAVLKGWVESRFGIRPTFHKMKLDDKESERDAIYSIDRMKGHARTNAIYSQLDLLFEFCQYELQRRMTYEKTLTLYRGTHDPNEYQVHEKREKRECLVQLNNLSSFTTDREKAWEFGSTVWRTRIPLSKIFFFSGLLPDSLLKGEDEYLVIGGEYWVKTLLY